MFWKHRIGKLVLFTFVLVILAVHKTSSANDYQVAGLNEHNKLRKPHGSPALTLNRNLDLLAVTCARYYAKIGKINHKCPAKNKMKQGENLAIRSKSMGAKKGVVDAIDSWYNEIKKYDFNQPGFSNTTGHFTQVVWKASKSLGMGTAVNGSRIFIVALYSPPGNFGDNNAYKNNVKPKQGKGKPYH